MKIILVYFILCLFFLNACNKVTSKNNSAYNELIGKWVSNSDQNEKIKITFYRNGKFIMEKSGERNFTYKITDVFTQKSQLFNNWDKYILDGEKGFSHVDGFSFHVNEARDSLFLFKKQITNFYLDSMYEIYLTKK